MIEIKRRELSSHPNVGNKVISACAGSIVTLLGPCGSGKSAFCRGLASLDQPEGYEVKLDKRDMTSIPMSERVLKIAYVPSDATLAFSGLKSTLLGEIDLTSRMAMPSAPESSVCIDDLITPFGLGYLLNRDPFTLSGGEAVRAALALALLKRPSILILDQIFDQIDPVAVPDLWAAIDSILPEASIIIQTASRQMRGADEPANGQISLSDVLERKDSFGQWQVTVQPRLDARNQRHSNTSISPTPCSSHREGSADLVQLSVRGLHFQYPDNGFLLGPMEIDAKSGERIALVGPNGAGKTTLLRCLAMLLEPQWELFEVRTDDRPATPPRDRRKLHEWAKTALYCFQRPEDQLYLGSIREELFASAKLSGDPKALERAIDYAERLGLGNWLNVSPFDAPRAVRRLCLIAGALAAGPPLLLLDEPTVGLDDQQFDALCDLISLEAPSTAIIFVSHDMQFVNRVADCAFSLGNSQQALN